MLYAGRSTRLSLQTSSTPSCGAPLPSTTPKGATLFDLASLSLPITQGANVQCMQCPVQLGLARLNELTPAQRLDLEGNC